MNPNARLLKVKLKMATVNDVGSMSLMSNSSIPNYYFVSLLNSNLLFDYYREFINCTVNIQINDLRMLPIIIPTEDELKKIENMFNKLYLEKKKAFYQNANNFSIVEELELLMDEYVGDLYKIQ